MQKHFRSFVVAVIVLLLTTFLLWPKMGAVAKEYLMGKVLGSALCPSGDGTTFDDEILARVDKNIALPAGYTPSGMMLIPRDIRATKTICIKEEVASYLRAMFNDAELENIKLAVTSGFRSSETQSVLYNALFKLKGKKAEDRIAKPLHSEHQLGTTMDLSGASINYLSASDKFIGTPESKWLEENAHKYGFIMSYPSGQKPATGYDYEPWHYRYVGTEVAEAMKKDGLTIGEYLDLQENKD